MDDEVLGPIIPHRGLRQGDPLSSYLFIIGAEGLTSLINQKEREELLHDCTISKENPRISHLFFADDDFLVF